MAPRLLDLFCGAGGAAMGYAHAGFEIIGVDAAPQPRYPFTFIKANALEFPLDGFDAIHASPPCKGYTKARIPGYQYPRTVDKVRDRLVTAGVPYVIENVPGAPLIDPVELCGSHFGLRAYWPGIGEVGLRRHRLFETSFPLPDPGPHDHRLRSIPVFGHSAGGNYPDYRGKGFAQACRDAMGIQWMKRDELSQAIPPAFTSYVGHYLMANHALTGGLPGNFTGDTMNYSQPSIHDWIDHG